MEPEPMARPVKIGGTPLDQRVTEAREELRVQKPTDRPGRIGVDVGKAVKRLLGKDEQSVARSKIASASMLLSGAGEDLERVCSKAQGGKLVFVDLETALWRVNEAATAVDAALSKEALAFSTPDDLRELKASYAEFLSSFRHYAAAFETLIDEGYKPLAGAFVEKHNQKGSVGKVMGSPPASTINAIERQLASFSESVERLLGHAFLFAAAK
jgi:hypothetical protein